MTTIIPRHYRLRLKPELNDYTIEGKTEITLDVQGPARDLELNAVELEIENCRLDYGEGFREVEYSTPDQASQSFTIRLPEGTRGMARLDIEYRGRINDSMLGFYRSRYTDLEGMEKYLAVTQFEESEARKAFPGFDHPRYKVPFDIEFIIDQELTGISNMPVAEERPVSGTKKLVRFQTTPPMPTYLLFFGVGEFDIVEDPGDVLLRAITTPGKTELARDGLAFARKCVEFLTEHFATPYPLPKLDLIAIPDFAFGAMENWGAMTFRENLLLVYPGITSRTAIRRLFTVIAHEIVHQWFGDLVSPAEWKYLWLNESFATLYGNIAVDDQYPEWETMEGFVLESSAGAFSRDALLRNFPIELGEEARITASTAPIIYDKGGAILRMAAAYLGNRIPTALEDYFRRHSYASARSSDLWEAFGRAAPDEPIIEMMKTWVTQPGHPLVSVQREGKELILRQERFTYLPDAPRNERWIIPLSIWTCSALDEEVIYRHILDDNESRLSMEEEVRDFKVNHAQAGFYRVKYPPAEHKMLARLVKDQRISGLDRYGLQEDLFALVRRGDFTLDDYLNFVAESYGKEQYPQVLRGIINNLSLLNLVMEGPPRERSSRLGLQVTTEVLNRIGFEPDPRETLPVSTLRSHALWHAVVFGSSEAADFTRHTFSRSSEAGDPIPPDIADAVFKSAAFLIPDALEPLIDRFENSRSEQERMLLAVAFGCVPPDNMRKAVRYALNQIPPRLRFIPLQVMSYNPGLAPLVWDMFSAFRSDLEKLPAAFFERVLIGIISIGGLAHPETVKHFFSGYAPEEMKTYQSHLQDTIAMALEILEVHLRLRRRS
jgi:tricorn protease interacting factor F2/3